MIQQLQGLQQEMLEAQEELAEMTATATAGGGAVTAVVTGERRLRSLTIAQEVVDPEDVEMLQDLVIAAVNEGMEQVDRITTERMSGFTAGLGIPGIA
jgi:DNA-binding YbaB/EbfC family protein